jgi:LysM repeat protein
VIDCAQPTTSEFPQTPATPVAGEAGTGGVRGVIIPVVIATPNPDGEIIHEVKAGQTLWQIAISYGTRIDEIKRLNNLYGDDIYPGMRLLVKQGVLLSPTVAVETAPVILAPTDLSALPSTRVSPASMPAPVQPQALPISTRSVTGYVIGILAIALLGGGIFVWLGNTKRE